VLFFSIVLFFQACSEDNDKNDGVTEGLPVPKLVSSIPVDNSSDVDYKIDSIQLVFDCDISLIKLSRIVLNGGPVLEAKANGKKLIIHISSLMPETKYTLSLESMAIKAINGGVNENPILLNFATGPKNEIFATGPKNEINITSDLTVSNPSSEVQNVYNFLKENYGSKIISGAMANVSWNINEAEWVYQHTGKYPAMNTFDYIHLNAAPANWIDYSDTQVVEDWWANNGLVSACWHWNVPVSEGSTEYTYKASETTFSAANATVEGTWENDIVNADLEEIAGYLNLLKNKNIPVIWRPLHEAAGNIYEYDGGKAWFWWGADGAQAFKNLWAYMFEYFQQQGLNNLIWVWTTQTKDDEFYPGDEYVDIIGRDIYNNNDAADIASQFDAIQDAYPTKMVTLSEMGSIANITEQWNSGALWSWFMPWYDYERTNDPGDADFSETNHTHADITWWEDAFSHDAVITRDEMPDLK
jgi:mannan endo-1,4-beta-mannosidase